MTRSIVLLLMLIGGCLIAAPQAIGAQTGPSFRCEKAAVTVEKTICGSRFLSTDDRNLATAYQAASRLVPQAELGAFRQSQRDWLASRSECENDNAPLQDCLNGRYATRLKLLQSAAHRSNAALADLLWTAGIVCAGNQALIRFAPDSDYGGESVVPGVVGSRLARDVAAPSQCRLANGTVVRFQHLSANDASARGACGANDTEFYSVWVGGRKVIDRDTRADKCMTHVVNAVLLADGKLTRCSLEAKLDQSGIVGRRCDDLSDKLGRTRLPRSDDAGRSAQRKLSA